MDFLEKTRAAYDTVAASYAETLRDALDASAFDRAVLGAFAERVSGPVADIGCGPGRITGYLHKIGLTTAFGIDLSPEMIAVARRSHPGIDFQVGDDVKHITNSYGHDGLDATAYRLQPARITELLTAAGLPVHATLIRDPEDREPTPQAYLFAHRA